MIVALLAASVFGVASDSVWANIDVRPSVVGGPAVDWIAFDSKSRIVETGHSPATLRVNLTAGARLVCAAGRDQQLSAHAEVSGGIELSASAHCVRIMMSDDQVVIEGVLDPRLAPASKG